MLCNCVKKKVVGLFRSLEGKLAPSPFVAQACSGAIKLAADPSIHLLWVNPTRRVARCKRTEQNEIEQNKTLLYNIT